MISKSLIVYYSWSNNTAEVAKVINKEIGGKVIELEPEKPYSSSYNQVLERAKKEIKNNLKPKLKNKIGDFDSYQIIFVSTPNWWSKIAPPVITFLDEYSFSKKIIVPFLTHGGGGEGNIFNDIARFCPDSKIKEGLVVRGSHVNRAKVKNWIKNVI